jgi:hypothetical protein
MGGLMDLVEVNGVPCQTGCVFDSHWGWHNTARVIRLAVELDCMTLTNEELAMVESYDDGTSEDGYYEALAFIANLDKHGVKHYFRAVQNSTFEIVQDMAQEAENALNEHTPEGFVWFWHDGDFFLNKICDEEEGCDDDECAHWAFC